MEGNRVIAAYSGGSLPAAIGIVRLSGPGCGDILARVFRPKSGKTITECEKNTMIYGELMAADGKTLDICMACRYEGPRSYTGEDMAEIFTHGSEAVVAAALRALYENGARPAEAGEFTRRAFLNGKLTLSEAEAVADLIYSKTEWSAKNAAALLKGANFERLRAMREDLLGLIAHFYAVCDYSDEDIEPFELDRAGETLRDMEARLAALYAGFERYSAISDGLPVAVIGRPNVGKSSLFNALAGFDRAIVTDEEGTTRDVVGQRIAVKGKDFNLLDTAGIRQGRSRAEELGIGRSIEAAGSAGLILAVFDGSEPLRAEDRDIIELCRGRKALAIVNKSDLPGVELPGLEEAFERVVRASAKDGRGVGEITSWLEGGYPDMGDGALITSPRQAGLIKEAMEALSRAAGSAGLGMTADAFLLDAEQAASLIGQVIGLGVDINIADGIFSRFCVGK